MREIDKIALAGFLHDIGKFRQRCGYSDISDGELATFCPSYKTYYSHLHAAHTAKAIEELNLPKELISLAANHHLHNLEGDEKIIQIADRYASSLDRKESNDILNKNDFITSAIETPFSYTYLDEKPKKHYYLLQKLRAPIHLTDIKNCNNEIEYKNLYEEFKKDILKTNLKFDNINDFLILKSIFETYTTFIPSSTYKTYPDVSLFDHSLATAAIAVAIKNGNENEFSLIQGDFSAIQSFIFSKFGESNKYLAKILRAKSLFVNTTTELVSLKIVKALNLSVFNIIMNAGGKFTILSHKLTQEDKKELESIKEWVNGEFEKINFAQTKFLIKSIDFDSSYFKLGEFSKVYKKMATGFEEEKLRFIPKKDVFEDYIEKAKNGICSVCGIVPLENSNDEICKYCKKFKELGERLPKAKYINFNLDDINSIELSNEPKNEISFSFKAYPLKRVANVVPKFGDDDLSNPKYQILDKNIEEIKKGSIKSFYHIAADGLRVEKDSLKGRAYLAILKADIDNLGKIFICGMRDEATFSRVLYLSRMIDFFFTDILMRKIDGKNIYTVFAGGDDLFLIGHYEDIIDTYKWIIENFQEYTKNRDFHLSSAIKLTRPNIPVNYMADLAENDLEAAKSLDGKDGVSIFDISLKNEEFQKLLKLVDFFEEINKNLKILNSGVTFMYRFYQFFEMEHNLKRGRDILQNSRWKYLLRYLIEKNFEIRKSDKDEIKEIKKEVIKSLLQLNELIEEYDNKLIIPLNIFLYSIREQRRRDV